MTLYGVGNMENVYKVLQNFDAFPNFLESGDNMSSFEIYILKISAQEHSRKQFVHHQTVGQTDRQTR